MMRRAPRLRSARRRHGVLVIVAARLPRQQALAIAEDHAVALVGEGPAALDEVAAVCRASRGSARTPISAVGVAHAPARRRQHRRQHASTATARSSRMRRSVLRTARSASRHFRRVGRPQPDVQLAQLLLVDRRWRVDQQVLAALRLGERDDVADRLGAAIIATMRSRPNAMPPCGGAPYCSASSRKPNFFRSPRRGCRARGTPSTARPPDGCAPSRRRSPSRSARCRTPWRRAARDRS